MIRHWLVPAGLALLTISWLMGACAVADRNAERERFLDAEQALRNGDSTTFERLRAELEGYPLYPYLAYEALSRRLHAAEAGAVDAFLRDHADTPLADRLRQEWLRLLMRRQAWEAFAEYYRPGLGTRMGCRYGWALYNAGEREKAFAQAKRMWHSGRSQPKECDPLFHAWRAADRLTSDLAWARIELAVAAREMRLARYLRRYLDETDQYWFDRWMAIHRSPESVLTAPWVTTEPDSDRRATLIRHAFFRMAAGNPGRAWKTWLDFREGHGLKGNPRYADIGRRIALVLAVRHAPEAGEAIDALFESARDEQMKAWRVRMALLDTDWEAVIRGIRGMSSQQRDETRWRYWLARGMDAMGKPEEAKALYRSIADRQEYYAFLAQDRLGQQYELDNQPIARNDAWSVTERSAGVERAFELYRLDRITEARREWRTAVQELDDTGLKQAGVLAAELGWHDRAIFALAQAGHFRDLGIRYPLEHEAAVLRYAASEAVSPALVFAVIRQESAFMKDARSRAGALGLMQIMPATGRHVARSMGQTLNGTTALLDPQLNLHFGTTYLREQLADHQDHPVLALAAYNAGPHRVAQWRPRYHWVDADIWAEIVPFAETRRYIRRTLAHMVIYENRLGIEPTPLSERMAPIAPRAYIRQADSGPSGG